MGRQVTYDDLAKHTGFSKTTISRFFNRPETVTPENQERIRTAMLALGYRENKVAKILAKGKTEFVGVLVPNLHLHYFSEMLNQILLTYEEFGYKFLVFVGNENEEVEKQYLEELMSYQIEGLIVMSHTLPSRELAQLPFPIVSIEREDEYISSVNCDNYMGAVQATSLLAKRGCEVLIHINSPTPRSVPAYQRLQGFSDFCVEHGLKHEIIVEDLGVQHATIAPGIATIVEQLEQKYPLQRKGIFLSDDTRANEFLNCLIRKYGTMPDSYRIIGFDNSPIAESAVLPISTVGQQIDLIAHEAVRLLVQQITQRKQKDPQEPLPVIHKVITPVLFRRSTTELSDFR
ncbi:MAG: substrate-binding domain-containing protein [Blautia sp.]|nr:substrate-binding domain-containing protein [Blautia sp.]